eukprot:SAG31_NODE_4184_length_3494_cov_7.133432_3_plen_313_part_00
MDTVKKIKINKKSTTTNRCGRKRNQGREPRFRLVQQQQPLTSTASGTSSKIIRCGRRRPTHRHHQRHRNKKSDFSGSAATRNKMAQSVARRSEQILGSNPSIPSTRHEQDTERDTEDGGRRAEGDTQRETEGDGDRERQNQRGRSRSTSACARRITRARAKKNVPGSNPGKCTHRLLLIEHSISHQPSSVIVSVSTRHEQGTQRETEGDRRKDRGRRRERDETKMSEVPSPTAGEALTVPCSSHARIAGTRPSERTATAQHQPSAAAWQRHRQCLDKARARQTEGDRRRRRQRQRETERERDETKYVRGPES